jgi:DNA-binding XRE family transcriptional regulator
MLGVCKNRHRQERNVMDTFLHKHAANVIGVLNGFDRLVFRGVLRRLVYIAGMKSYLWAANVLLKDFVVEKKEKPDVKSIRSKFGISQPEFAAMMGISVRTFENWEQGHRTPKGPASVLLKVAEAHPEAVWDVVKPKREVKRLG